LIKHHRLKNALSSEMLRVPTPMSIMSGSLKPFCAFPGFGWSNLDCSFSSSTMRRLSHVSGSLNAVLQSVPPMRTAHPEDGICNPHSQIDSCKRRSQAGRENYKDRQLHLHDIP
jgi:hypothetical protein